jgi:energy-coupling factor transporter transmembrane protein EcfT
MTIAHFPPALLGLLLMFTGLAMAGARAGYWLFVVGIKSVVMLALIAASVVWYATSNAHAQTIPACVTELSANTDPCLMTGKAGLYFMSREKGYSLNCGSYDCEKMIQIYLKTKRIPEPIER